MSSEAAQYGRHGFLLNGLFVEDGIVRSYRLSKRFMGDMVFTDDEHGVIAAPVIGVALCEFPDEDGGAVHAAFVLMVQREWGVELYDGSAPGGQCFLAVTQQWPADKSEWLHLVRTAKGSTTHGKEDDAPAPEGAQSGWDDTDRPILGGIATQGEVRIRFETDPGDGGSRGALPDGPERGPGRPG